MSLHKLAQVTITIEGLPEYTGTDNELQELIEDAKDLLQSTHIDALLIKRLRDWFPGLSDKIEIKVTGID